MQVSLFRRKVAAVMLSILLLSLGWLGVTGFTLLGALTPLLWISSIAEDSRRGWWQTFAWLAAAVVGWNISTIWWIGYATPIGPVAATVASSFYTMTAFMVFHTVSRRAPKALAYTIFVSLWIAFEYNYTVSEFSWPWLLLGNGFSNDVWAIQWYEYTGIFGGSLWVLLSNILLFEAWGSRAKIYRALAFILAPVLVSVLIYATYSEPESARTMEVSAVQPNIDFYDDVESSPPSREGRLMAMMKEVSPTCDLILMPEITLPYTYWESSLGKARYVGQLRMAMRRYAPEAELVAGVSTRVPYREGEQTETARKAQMSEGEYYDVFNSAMAIDTHDDMELRHKVRLVIGVENTPTWIFEIFKFFVVEVGDITGQLGRGVGAETFDIGGDKVGVVICYENVYGDFCGEFVRNGAQMLAVITNECWWGDTPGYRHLYSFSQIRAIEHRRAIVRSANTGISGFITARGDSVGSLGWDEQGVLSQEVTLSDEMTLYTLWGDYVARIAVLVAALSMLYYVSYRARKRHHIV